MESVLKVAMPLLAATVAVPLRVPPPALVPMATVTLELSPVTRFPNWSSTRTVTGGLIITPATVVPGWTPKPRGFAPAVTTANRGEGGPVMPAAPTLPNAQEPTGVRARLLQEAT